MPAIELRLSIAPADGWPLQLRFGDEGHAEQTTYGAVVAGRITGLRGHADAAALPAESAVPLRFLLPPAAGYPLRIRFGEDGDSSTGPEYGATAGGTITGLRGHAVAPLAVVVEARGRVTGLRGHAGAGWDSDVDRPLAASHVSRFDEASTTAAASRSWFDQARHAGAPKRAAFDQALRAGAVGGGRFEQARTHAQGNAQWFEQALQAGHAHSASFEQALSFAVGAAQQFEQALCLGVARRADYQQAINLVAGRLARLEQAIATGVVSRSPFNRAAERRVANQWSGFQQATRPWASRVRHVEPPEHACYDPSLPLHLRFELPAAPGLPLALRFVCEADGAVEPEPPRIIVPVRTVYMVVNELDLRRVDGNIRLPAFTASLGLNKDSTTWSFSATLGRAALPDIQDATVGQPVEVELTVNGALYRLMIEDVKRDRQFPDVRINVTGRGKSALLDAPHAPLLNFDNRAGARTAQQLMLDALTIGGVPFGWDVDFGLQDWLVSAGAWMHHGSYLSAVSAIAAAAGGYVQPHPTAQTLRVLPNYPSAPWDWATQIVPDIELPAAVLVQEGTHWTPKPIYNQVHLAGELGGVLADVWRGGTARDLPADMVVDPLITDEVVARQRGRAILSDVGAQAVLTFSLPVLPETGLILPGKFLRRVDGPEVLQGYVRSMQMDWSAPRLRQTIEVQTHG